MKYMILIYESETAFRNRGDAENSGAYWGAYKAYTERLRASGVMAGGHGLQPPFAATTVRVTGGGRTVQDGPYADAKEQLGGFYIIDVPDLDAALDVAAACPAATEGAVEVRPLLVMG
jgi:hypothetical protein